MSRSVTRRGYLQRGAAAISLTGIAGCLSGGGSDGDFPSENITCIVPWSEGGGADTYARHFMPLISEELPVEVKIENVPGSGGLKGTAQVINSEPDGYNLLTINPPSEIIGSLVQGPDFDITEVKGVAVYGQSSWVLMTHEDYNIESFEDLAQRYQQGEFENLGVVQGAASEFVHPEKLKNAGLEWDQIINYDGSGPTNQAVLSKEVPVGLVTSPAAVVPAKDAAEVVVTVADERDNAFPDVPSISADLGYEEIGATGWLFRGVWTTPDTPLERRQVVADAVKAAVESDETEQWSEETGNGVRYRGPEEATKIVDEIHNELEEVVGN